MKKPFFTAAVAVALACLSASELRAQSVTAPASQVNITAANEWATKTFQDPIDMNQRTDLSWWLYAVDQPYVNLSGIAFAQNCTGSSLTAKCFKATTTSTGSNFWILESPDPGSNGMGKNGENFPIDANTYKVVAMRMRLGNPAASCPALDPPGIKVPDCLTSFLWNQTSLYDGLPTTYSRGIKTYDGWGIYFVDLPGHGLDPSNNYTSWAGTIRDLRYNLPQISGANMEFDWIRLVPNNLPTQTITWSGFAGYVDIYLDDDQDPSNGNLGLIVQANRDDLTDPAYRLPASPSSYTFQPGMLAAGDYYVEICPTGTTPTSSSCKYSAGFYRVNDIPTMALTSPLAEGSADDFATVQLNQPWDMTSTRQVDYYGNLTGLNQTEISAVDEKAVSLGNVDVLEGTSTAVGGSVGDPFLYYLWYAADGKGRFKKIDSSRYHILTVEMGLPNKARDLYRGSIARMIWQVEGEAPRQNVSADIQLNTAAGENTMVKFTTSMRTCAPGSTDWYHCMKLETDAGDPATVITSGWHGNVENFRLDPHEFPGAQPFYVKRIKLAANEKTVSNQYTIRWTYNASYVAGSPTLTLYRDTDTDPSSGLVQIATGINPATTTSYTWNTSGVPDGTYYIYALFNSDGVNNNGTYSRWPIIVSSTNTSSSLPRIALSRRRVDTSGSDNGRIVSPPQSVTVDVIGSGASSVGWTVTSSHPSVVVSPTSGTGPGTFTISMASSTAYPDNLVGDYYVTVSETVAGTTWNSPQTIRVLFTMHAKTGTTAPVGFFDLPIAGSTGVEGSFPVTGWAIDDVGVSKVRLYRNFVTDVDPEGAKDPDPSSPSYGQVYVADALFVAGTRPDIEIAYPYLPFTNRAGWGYLLLSWGLPDKGNSTYTLYAYAYDVDGHVTSLGSKTIGVDNNHATKPFGAIDTPEYGGTASGNNFRNWGWALTPNHTPTCRINNGFVAMSIDGAPPQAVTYGTVRDDIASFFSGFSNGSNGGGYRDVNTTLLDNGMHTISWVATDDCGRTEGMGSRYFWVLNAAGDAIPAAGDIGVAAGSTAKRSALPVVRSTPAFVMVRQANSDWTIVSPTADGARVIELAQDGRIEVQLPLATGGYAGYQDVGGARRDLPIGSSLDVRTGIFYWQPGAGFLGAFNLLFVSPDGTGVKVRVVVGPPMRIAIDTPAPDAKVQSPFVVSGWAADLATEGGSGVDAVHLWAYPVSGGAPIWLGVAAYGDARPDVGAVYGASLTNSSYTLEVDRLPAGTFDIVVYAHRTKTASFDAAQVVRVTVR